MKQIEKALEVLNVKISRLVVKNDSKHDIVVTGGIEVINRYPVKDFKEVNDSWEKVDVQATSNNERILLPFMYTDTKFEVGHLEKLIRFRGMKTLSKEQSLDYEVENKKDLVSKIVYIHEENPSTNSLALAKQFGIKHYNVIQQIFKLAEQNPSILMGVEYGVYEDSIPMKGSSMGKVNKSVENKPRDGKWAIEHSITQTDNTQIAYNTFLHISEDVYYKFVMKLGTPKTAEMKVYRHEKQEEYFKAFQNIREMLYKQGYKEDEILTLIRRRTIVTNKLLDSINDYTIHFNNNTSVIRHMSVVGLCRLIFNITNTLAKIDAKHYKHKSKDRDEKDIETQMELVQYESAVVTTLNSCKKHKINLLVGMCDALNIDLQYIENVIADNDVPGLLSTLEKLK